jgi:hypothetical protein
MKKHIYQNSNPQAFDSDCIDCGGKYRDAIHEKGRRGLYCDVLFNQHFEDCPLNVIQKSKTQEVFLVNEEGPFHEEDAKRRNIPVVELVKRKGIGRNGADYLHVVPAGVTFSQFGGSFITDSDSRFPSDYPIPIHDRIEPQERN